MTVIRYKFVSVSVPRHDFAVFTVVDDQIQFVVVVVMNDFVQSYNVLMIQ